MSREFRIRIRQIPDIGLSKRMKINWLPALTSAIWV